MRLSYYERFFCHRMIALAFRDKLSNIDQDGYQALENGNFCTMATGDCSEGTWPRSPR